MQRNGMAKGWLGATSGLMALMLVAGVAWAAQTASVNTPAGQECQVVAVVTPGSNGGVVWGPGHIEEDFEFSVGFDPDGTVSINGQPGTTTDLNVAHTVDATFYELGGVWYVDATVFASGNVVAQDLGRALGSAAPPSVMATAGTVHFLAVQ